MSRPSCQPTECMACRAVRASIQPRSRAGLPDTPGPGGKQSACCIHRRRCIRPTTPTAVRITTLRGSSGTRISNSLEVAHRNRVEICLRDVPTFRPSTLERSGGSLARAPCGRSCSRADPADYGSSCGNIDLVLPPFCATRGSSSGVQVLPEVDNNHWCYNSWCYVDENACNITAASGLVQVTASAFFPGLYYS